MDKYPIRKPTQSGITVYSITIPIADKMTTIYGKWIKILNGNNLYYMVYKDTCDAMYYTRYVGNNKFTLYDINTHEMIEDLLEI